MPKFLPWILGGATVLAAGVGGFFYLRAKSAEAQAKAQAEALARAQAEARAAEERRRQQEADARRGEGGFLDTVLDVGKSLLPLLLAL